MSFQQIGDDILLAYADGELDAARRAGIDALLAEMPELRAKLDALLQLQRGLRATLIAVDQVPTPKRRITEGVAQRLRPAFFEPRPALFSAIRRDRSLQGRGTMAPARV